MTDQANTPDPRITVNRGDSMRIYQISPTKVLNDQWSPERDIKHQSGRLLTEGQIEPIVCFPLEVDERGEPAEGCQWMLNLLHPDYWHYSPAQVEAAVRLNWPTILVTY